MTAACLLPSELVQHWLLDPPVAALSLRFPGKAWRFYCRAAHVAAYAALLPYRTVEPIDRFTGGHDPVVALTLRPWLDGLEFDPPYDRPLPQLLGEGQRVRLMSLHGFLLEGIVRDGAIQLGTEAVIRDLCPEFDHHVFGRLGPIDRGLTDVFSFTHFPYGYLMRNLGTGRVNSYGFRIPFDYLPLVSRPREHTIIAVFGGSSTFSLYSPDTTSFPEVLQDTLNTWCRDTGRNRQFTVLNFGVPGHVVIHEMLTFLLFAAKIRPDIVIAHDGFNDIHYALASDEVLLKEHDLTYPTNLETWSYVLHGSSGPPAYGATIRAPEVHGHEPTNARSLNVGIDAARAYVARKRQFKTVAEGLGCRFIWGVQPYFGSKNALTEREAYGSQDYRDTFPREADILPGIIDLLSKRTVHDAGSVVVDLHAALGRRSTTETLFADHVHTLPRGDAVIAAAYAEVIQSLTDRADNTGPTPPLRPVP